MFGCKKRRKRGIVKKKGRGVLRSVHVGTVMHYVFNLISHMAGFFGLTYLYVYVYIYVYIYIYIYI